MCVCVCECVRVSVCACVCECVTHHLGVLAGGKEGQQCCHLLFAHLFSDVQFENTQQCLSDTSQLLVSDGCGTLPCHHTHRATHLTVEHSYHIKDELNTKLISTVGEVVLDYVR